MKQIEKHKPMDFILHGSTCLENPFFAELYGTFTGPDGQVYRVPGFYNGEDQWVVRFSANAPGVWTYEISSRQIVLAAEESSGSLECVDSDARGAVIVDPKNPLRLAYENGSPYFMVGYECNWMWAMPLDEINAFADQIAGYGFNMLITNVYAYDCLWREGNTSPRDFGPPPMCMWEGTNDAPDYARMNLSYFRHYDAFISALADRGINVCLYYRVYNKMVQWMKNYSAEDEFYIRYVTARYQAYTNVVWNFSKETFYEPDLQYIGWYIDRIKQYDAYHRLVTAHDASEFSDVPELHRKLDFVSPQHHEHYYNRPDFHCYALHRRLLYQKPVFMIEIGYECGQGGPDDLTYNVGHTAEEFLDIALDVVFAQCYPAYYYTYTAWDVIDYSFIPPGYAYFKNMADIVNRYALFDWEIKMPTLAYSPKRLVRGSDEQMFFFERGRSYLLNIAALRRFSGKKICAEWINVQKNETVPADLAQGQQWIYTDTLMMIDPPTKDEVYLLHVWME